MTIADIIAYRLISQQIAETRFKKPQEIVSWFVAMQSQQFAMAKWAIGLRIPALKDADVEQAFNEGAILRTHLVRPTWHFVTPADIRWMLLLTAPRINAANAFMYRKMELDNKIFKRSNTVLAKALQGGKQLTRTALQSELRRAKIMADGIRLGLLMMRAELDGIICSGPRQGKQFTYALLAEKVPEQPLPHREEAMASLLQRYFISRGPATLRDFVYWSGLMMKDAGAAFSSIQSKWIKEKIDGHEYIFSPDLPEDPQRLIREKKLQASFLMPDYDEYGMSYKNRTALFTTEKAGMINRTANANTHLIAVNGRIEGVWKKTMKGNNAEIEPHFFSNLNKTQQQAVKKAIKKYISFTQNA